MVFLEAVGTFAGVSVPFVVAYVRYRKRKKDQLRRVRKALLHEIGRTYGVLDTVEEYIQAREYLPSYYPSTAVYESVGSVLGDMTDEEVRAITDYYTWAHNIQWKMSDINNPNREILFRNLLTLHELADDALTEIETVSGLERKVPDFEIDDVVIKDTTSTESE
ncbi:hypothetical protein [Salinigranum rubrum]|uniref:hypothetical protein n=1 Tax=Salinigranum rubrum TaxID=755307 RepID=UPI0013A535A9|nr:hypothetical protein [Salinigranum rubrum]